MFSIVSLCYTFLLLYYMSQLFTNKKKRNVFVFHSSGLDELRVKVKIWQKFQKNSFIHFTSQNIHCFIVTDLLYFEYFVKTVSQIAVRISRRNMLKKTDVSRCLFMFVVIYWNCTAKYSK